MKIQSISKRLAAVVLALAIAGPAGASGINGAGVLVDVDSEANKVTVRKNVFSVVPTSEIFDAKGHPMKLWELEGSLGEWVFYKGMEGHDGAVLEALQIAPDDEN